MEIARRVGPAATTIDAGGRALLTSLDSSHVHPLGGEGERDHPIPIFFNSLDAIRAYLGDRSRAQPEGTWIVVRYAFPIRLKESRFPTRAEVLRFASIDFATIDNARLHSAEREKGPIGPGKLADLVLVDRDPLGCPEDDLRTTRVLGTIVGDRVVHRAGSD